MPGATERLASLIVGHVDLDAEHARPPVQMLTANAHATQRGLVANSPNHARARRSIPPGDYWIREFVAAWKAFHLPREPERLSHYARLVDDELWFSTTYGGGREHA